MRTVLVLMDTLRRDVLSCYNPTTDVQTPNLDALVLMDTLRRDVLSCYNPTTDVQTPNLDAFAGQSCVFDNHWIGSAPCRPARRDILTGRYNFLERPWGPIEPFDVTLPACLRANGNFCHITTDHRQYLRTGGEGYLQEFNTWDYYRGQEGDPWVSRIDEPGNMPETFYGRVREQYQKNRQLWPNEEDMPSPKTFPCAPVARAICRSSTLGTTTAARRATRGSAASTSRATCPRPFTGACASSIRRTVSCGRTRRTCRVPRPSSPPATGSTATPGPMTSSSWSRPSIRMSPSTSRTSTWRCTAAPAGSTATISRSPSTSAYPPPT